MLSLSWNDYSTLCAVLRINSKRKNTKKSEQGLKDLGPQKWISMCVIGVPWEKRKGTERIFEETVAESLPNLMKDINVINIQEGQRTPNRINTRTYEARYHMIKLWKTKGRICRKRWLVIYKWYSVWLTANYL